MKRVSHFTSINRLAQSEREDFQHTKLFHSAPTSCIMYHQQERASAHSLFWERVVQATTTKTGMSASSGVLMSSHCLQENSQKLALFASRPRLLALLEKCERWYHAHTFSTGPGYGAAAIRLPAMQSLHKTQIHRSGSISRLLYDVESRSRHARPTSTLVPQFILIFANFFFQLSAALDQSFGAKYQLRYRPALLSGTSWLPNGETRVLSIS